MECCHRTIEDVLRKLLEEQEQWYYIIDLILFAIRTTRHSLMGMSLYRVIFNKDPLLPFEFADKQKMQLNVTDSDSESDESVTDNCNGTDNEVESSSGMDQLMAMVQKLEFQRAKVFKNGHSNIKEAQAQQTRSYNNRNCAGKPFEIGNHVFKKISFIKLNGGS